MSGEEYINRLIEDVAKSKETRQQVDDPLTQIKMIKYTGKADIPNFWSALNVMEADAHLDILVQFINGNGRLVNHEKGDRVDIDVWEKDLNENREPIGHIFQQIIDNDQLIDAMSGRPISEFLIEQLDYIHQSAN